MSSHQPARISVVEDDAVLRGDLVEFLDRCGFAACGFESAEALYRGMAAKPFDLALLDILLPSESGLEIARWLRENLPSVGIVMLTSLDSASDQVQGLGAGADAYLPKNAPLDVIEATCRSVLRRMANVAVQPARNAAPVSGSGWGLNPYSCFLLPPQGVSVAITHAEAIFLEALIRSPGKPVSRDTLVALMGKPPTLNNLRNLDSQVRRIRTKVQSACGVELPVKPSYGIGYLFTGEGLILDHRATPRKKE